MSEKTGYQGWASYPTWAVNLWLSNDQLLYNETLSRTSEAMDAAEAEQIEHPYWTEEQCLRYGVSDTLKAWVAGELAPDLGATFASDLFSYALDKVDWHEIADAWIENVTEQAS